MLRVIDSAGLSEQRHRKIAEASGVERGGVVGLPRSFFVRFCCTSLIRLACQQLALFYFIDFTCLSGTRLCANSLAAFVFQRLSGAGAGTLPGRDRVRDALRDAGFGAIAGTWRRLR